MNYIIIPARYDSTRFPGKPLALINDLPMAVMTYRACQEAGGFDDVILLTNSKAIYDECNDYGINCELHEVEAENGTERIGLYAATCMDEDDLIVNVQCDEPLMTADIPQRLLFNLKNKPGMVWTAARYMRGTTDMTSQDVVKCEVKSGFIHPQDFSRTYMPGFDWVHVGVYAYSVGRLREYVERGSTVSERTYRMEQLRWQEPLAAITVSYNGVSVDRPEHIAMVEERLKA